MEHTEHKKIRTCWWIGLAALLVLIGLGIWGYRFVKKTYTTVIEQRDAIIEQYGEETLTQAQAIIPYFLGFGQKRRFLVLMQNDTELRPTGGFIGTYATIEIQNGKIEQWFAEGTERLDARATTSSVPAAPEPLQRYLAQPKFYFRDANWSPDFPASARDLIQKYALESGNTDSFDGVIAISATFMERMMRHIGPLTVDGVTFTAENFIEQLEHEVEYGYDERGDNFANRKEIIGDMIHALMGVIEERFLELWPLALRTLFDSLADKHVLLYAQDADVQALIVKQQWGGALTPLALGQDGFMVVDANLASLKTDRVIERSIQYQLRKESASSSSSKSDRWIGEVRVTYKNTGSFDWRTTRYRSYTRVFLPKGATFIEGTGAMKKDRSNEAGTFAVSEEQGRTVVGAFFSVEPKNEHTLVLRYALPAAVADAITKGEYTLLVQKQPSTQPRLTLDLQFGKNIRTAEPAEPSPQWGDGQYRLTTTLQTDQSVSLEFAP